MGFGDNLFNAVRNVIEDWKPEEAYTNENKYRDDLLSFLRENSTRASITKESGRGLCDIAVDRRIGIELKKDLRKKAQIDRLIGQITEYKRDYEEIIVVLVGESYEDAIENLKDRLRDMNKNVGGFGLSQEAKISFLNKTWDDSEDDYEDDEEDNRSSGSGGFRDPLAGFKDPFENYKDPFA